VLWWLQIGAIWFTALTAIVIVALLVLTSATNAAIASFLMSVSIIGFFVAFFFSSVSLLYFGALGFGGLTIGSVAFLSVCAVLFFSGLSKSSGFYQSPLFLCLKSFLTSTQLNLDVARCGRKTENVVEVFAVSHGINIWW
jgi:hypothetical protein